MVRTIYINGFAINTKSALEDFQKVIPKQINDVLDRGYEVFKNSPMSVADNYGPSSKVINKAVEEFKDVAARERYYELTDDVAKNMVNEVWANAQLPKGVMMNEGTKSGTVRLGSVPNFFLKSEADNLLSRKGDFIKTSGGKNLSDLTGVGEQIIKRLLGKAENPMSTIVEGTNALSIQIRLNQYLDDLVKQSNILKKNWDEWDSWW